VNQRLTSPVREICTLGSVGAGGGRLPPATQWALSDERPYRVRNNLLGSRNVVLSLLGYEIYDPDELVLLGLCQEPPAAIRATACFGPHVPRL
jgi:hypothetical protein